MLILLKIECKSPEVVLSSAILMSKNLQHKYL